MREDCKFRADLVEDEGEFHFLVASDLDLASVGEYFASGAGSGSSGARAVILVIHDVTLIDSAGLVVLDNPDRGHTEVGRVGAIYCETASTATMNAV